VARRLELAGPRPWKLVLLHQPVAVTRPQDSKNLLHGHAQAVRSWRAAGAHMVLGGHIHLPCVVPLPAPQPGPVLWMVQAGTAVSWRVRAEAGNSVNLIRLCQAPHRQAVVERWDYQADSGQFNRVARHTLPGAPR